LTSLRLDWIAGAGRRARPVAWILWLLSWLGKLLDSPAGILLPLLVVIPLLLALA
jgi:hypothetical protein